MANPFRYPVVVVEWLDASARNQAVEYNDTEVDQYHRAEPVKTLGLLIKENEAGISLYTEETGPDGIRGLSFIPRAMIKSVDRYTLTRIRPKRPKKCAEPSSPPSSPLP